jgi:hypothetical protein
VSEGLEGWAVDSDYYNRRIRKLGSVLAVPIELNPGEHLRDATLRGISINGHAYTKVAVELTKARSFRSLSALTSIAASQEIDSLVDVLGIRRDSEDLKRMLSQPQTGSRIYVSFFGQTIRRSYFTRRRRVSPLALRINEYQRAIWAVRWISFDTETMEALLDHCPVCTRPLGWAISFGVSRCEHCKADLRDFPQSKVNTQDEEALKFFTDTVNPVVSESEFAQKWPTIYPASTRGEIFEFIVRLAMECQRFQKGQRGAITSVENEHLESAGRAVLNWPTGFTDLMDGLQNDQSDALRNLCKDAQLTRATRLRLQQFLRVRDRRSAIFSPSGHRSGLNTGDLQRFHASELGATPISEPRSEFGCRPEVVIQLARTIKSIRQRAQTLGLPVTDVIDLHLDGFLDDLAPDLQSLGIVPRCPSRKVDLARLLAGIKARSHGGTRLSTARFTFDQTLSARFSDIVKAILAEEIVVSLGPASTRGFMYDIFVENLESLCAVVGRSARNLGLESVSLTVLDVAMFMGKSRGVATMGIKSLHMSNRLTVSSFSEARNSSVFSFELECLQRLHGQSGERVHDKLVSAGVPHIKGQGITVWSRNEALDCLALKNLN